MLQPGDEAPDFQLSDAQGNTVRISDWRGRKVLVYFYPKADTPGCTRQACTVRDAQAELAAAGIMAVGISPDKPKALTAFGAKYGLGFPLLSDPDRTAAKAFGAYGEKRMYGKVSEGIIRSALLLDEEGRVMAAWYGVKPEDTAALALAAVNKENR